MTKSDTDFSKIDTSPARGTLNQPTWRDGTPIVAFDFETDGNGDPFLLSVSPPHSDAYCVTPKGSRDTLSSETILDELASNKWRDHLCVWFNIGFDAEVFISGLGIERAQEIRIENETVIEREPYNGLSVTYIDGKLLEFESKNGHKISHYDIGNIVRGSLDNCAKEWLREEKVESIDASKFHDPEYRQKHEQEIRHYAKVDAQLTRRLAEVVTEKAESLDIPMGRPVSTGYMASEFARERLSEKPGRGPSWVQQMAWNSYAGGRFEVYERGDVGEVAGPDINSAYPWVLSELPDPGSLRWKPPYANPSYEDCKEADYGFVKATVTTVDNARIMPFAEKIDNKVCYPSLENHTLTVILPVFEHAVESGLLEDFEIHQLAHGYETKNTIYPFDFLKEIYDERKRLEANGKELAGLMLKIAMNSLYGKTAQTTLKQEIIEEAIDINEIRQDEGMRLLTMDDIPIRERQEAGKLFNPFIASYITGMTRLELHKTVLECGLEKDTVLLATDCIMVHADAYDRSSFDRKLGDKLGDWDFDYRGDAFVIGSGVYEIYLGECKHRDCPDYKTIDCDVRKHKCKTKTRGFREADLGSGGLKGAARKANGDPITIANERPITLGEALSRNSKVSVDEIGRFLAKNETERALKPDFDTKRNWQRSAEYSDLLEGSEYGEPITLSGD